MYTIENSADFPHLSPQFFDWIESEWGNPQSADEKMVPDSIPTPLFAIENDVLLGGLSFTTHLKPDSEVTGIWINTLYVAPDSRKRGIGAALIEAASEKAKQLNIDELYVYTDKPEIYEKHGWAIVKIVDDHTVLTKSF